MSDFKLKPYQKEVFDHIVRKNVVPKMLMRGKPTFVGVDMAEKGGDKTSIVTGIQGRKGEIFIIDEYSTMPDYKWYRNPIKWWKWRRLMKSIWKQMKKDNNIWTSFSS